MSITPTPPLKPHQQGLSLAPHSPDEMCEVAQRIGELVKDWGITAGTCGEITDLDRYGIEHNRCIDDRLMVKCFAHDRELMDFIGYDPQGELFDLCTDAERESDEQRRHARLKDKGQRLACGCIISKDIGEYKPARISATAATPTPTTPWR